MTHPTEHSPLATGTAGEGNCPGGPSQAAAGALSLDEARKMIWQPERSNAELLAACRVVINGRGNMFFDEGLEHDRVMARRLRATILEDVSMIETTRREGDA